MWNTVENEENWKWAGYFIDGLINILAKNEQK